MSTLSREYRRLLENTVAHARTIAEEGARKVLADQYAVHSHEPWPHMTADDRELRNQLRAHGRQLGDSRDPKRETQEIKHLVQACAYEHWHRMLFSRFLAENDLLLDEQHGVTMTLDDVREFAREQNRDWMDIAAELAQRMLLAVFRPDDPVLKVRLPPETQQLLEQKLASLPREIFQADDSLGWVYQFWQRDEKDRVNQSEVKIGADELPAVTQLFTEDYMVLFLLHNTLGAWWTAKRCAEHKDPALAGYEWTYLRLNKDGSPAAGVFDDWPRFARELRVLDPCMGSGHFLVFALPILTRMRMEEERLSLEDALSAVLRDNLFGLEIDARCSQIAAFNLALAGWRMAGQHFALPEMNLACSGLGIHALEADWLRLAHGDFVADQWMSRLYSLFRDAPTLGSLIDPTKFLEDGQEVGFERVLPLIEEALERERSVETRELAIAAQGVLAAFRILSSRFTLVVTNVPYLWRGKQAPALAKFCEVFHRDAKNDLAACFVDRSLRFASKGSTAALVTPQSWLYLPSYKKLRQRLLAQDRFDVIARLGAGAFETVSGEVVNVILTVITNDQPSDGSTFFGLDADEHPDKAAGLLLLPAKELKQKAQLSNPDSRIVLGTLLSAPPLSDYAEVTFGICTGDYPRFIRAFWELPRLDENWEVYSRPDDAKNNGIARSEVVLWERGSGQLMQLVQEKLGVGNEAAWLRGHTCWGHRGVVVQLVRSLSASLYEGQKYDQTLAAVIPKNAKDLPALWAFLSSSEFVKSVRTMDQAMKLTPGTIGKVPLEFERWRAVADKAYPTGVPKFSSRAPDQWLDDGYPKCSDYPLQVAVARLMGYGWPRQTGSDFPDWPALGQDSLDKYASPDGIVCLSALGGEAPAVDRLRALLADAYGSEWSAAKIRELLGDWKSLEEWLRDGFFEEHTRIFRQRPFVWHVWDGRKDGFHALVNYHKLAGPNGDGRKTLERLLYTYLGRWIERGRDEVKGGKEGADARLTAATHLKTELDKILNGEKPFDIFVRWKPLHEQPIGWEPDINDGVRLNIRPWLTAKPYQASRRDGCILRATPKISYGKDRGQEPLRPKEGFPWFWSWDEHTDNFFGRDKFDGARWNDLHYSLDKKKEARVLKQAAEATR